MRRKNEHDVLNIQGVIIKRRFAGCGEKLKFEQESKNKSRALRLFSSFPFFLVFISFIHNYCWDFLLFCNYSTLLQELK